MSAGIVWLSVAAVFTLPTALVLFVIFRNHKTADQYYQGMYDNVEQERLGQLLKAEGVNLEQYIRSNNSIDVFKAIKRCSNCQHHNNCDSHLATEQKGIPEYCENQQSIERVKEAAVEA
jgi:hypothetical protein